MTVFCKFTAGNEIYVYGHSNKTFTCICANNVPNGHKAYDIVFSRPDLLIEHIQAHHKFGHSIVDFNGLIDSIINYAIENALPN